MAKYIVVRVSIDDEAADRNEKCFSYSVNNNAIETLADAEALMKHIGKWAMKNFAKAVVKMKEDK